MNWEKQIKSLLEVQIIIQDPVNILPASMELYKLFFYTVDMGIHPYNSKTTFDMLKEKYYSGSEEKSDRYLVITLDTNIFVNRLKKIPTSKINNINNLNILNRIKLLNRTEYIGLTSNKIINNIKEIDLNNIRKNLLEKIKKFNPQNPINLTNINWIVELLIMLNYNKIIKLISNPNLKIKIMSDINPSIKLVH